MIQKIHQVFFDFDGRKLTDYPIFVRSQRAYKDMKGWEYKLWNERAVDRLCRKKYPKLWPVYASLPYAISRVDLAKIMILDSEGGCVSDLDVIPRRPLSDVIGDGTRYLFDKCSRKHVIANDFMFAGHVQGLPGIFDYFEENLKRVRAIPAYKTRKLRFVFHTSGPDFFTRYLKRTGLAKYARGISNRTFLDPKQRHRDVRTRGALVDIVHHLSWAPHVQA